MNGHYKKYHQITKEERTCSFCGKELSSKDAVVRHLGICKEFKKKKWKIGSSPATPFLGENKSRHSYNLDTELNDEEMAILDGFENFLFDEGKGNLLTPTKYFLGKGKKRKLAPNTIYTYKSNVVQFFRWMKVN